MRRNFILVIDGPAGSGKSSTAKILASRLGLTYLDTGAMYRCVALAASMEGVDLTDEEAVAEVAGKIEIGFAANGDRTIITLNNNDVSLAIRTPEMDSGSSLVSSYRAVREKMVELQRKIGSKGGLVAEGRDMGTVVFPDADLKIFLVADLDARAERRYLQLKESGIQTSVEKQKSSLYSRDESDSSRAHSPLRKAHDAIEIDTTRLKLEGQVEKIYELALEKIERQ